MGMCQLQARVHRFIEIHLFYLRKIVVGVFIQDELPDWTHWVVLVRPDLGEIENVVPELLRLLWSHGLLGNLVKGSNVALTRDTDHIDRPRRVSAGFDSLEESLDTVIRVLARQPSSGGVVQGLSWLNLQQSTRQKMHTLKPPSAMT